MKTGSKRSILFLIVLSWIVLQSKPARADLQQQLNELADSLGAMSATTAPGVYEGQTRGYLSGGGLSMRFPQRSLNLASLSLPKLRAGCEGIDIYLGAFSYINAQQLIDKLQAIGSASLGYAFGIALQSISPQIYGVMQDLEKYSQAINSTNFSSCQAARALVDGTLGLVEKIGSSQVSRCTGARTASGASTDFNAARQECVADPAAGASVGDAEDQAVGRIERNYLWDALFNLVGLDWTSQELILSAIGTIVVTQSSGVTTWPPLISVDMLLDGGAVSRYSCDAACLNMNVVSEGNVTGLIVLVRDRLTAILAQVQARGDLSPSDIDFVTTAPFPLYRMVNALSTLTPAVAEAYLHKWAEPLALLMVQEWIDATAREARRALSKARIDEAVQKELFNMIEEAKGEIRNRMARTRFVADSIVTEIETLERLERAITSSLKRHDLAKAYDFGKKGK